MNLIVLLSQVDTASVPEWAKIATMFAAAGFTSWYAWYTTTVTIPRLNDQHAGVIEKVNNQNAEIIKTLVGEFRGEAKEQRAAEWERDKVSNELARSGHAAMTQVTVAINDLRGALDRQPLKGG